MPGKWLMLLGAGLAALGIAGAGVALLGSHDAPLRRSFTRYAAYLDRELRFLFSPRSGFEVALMQVMGALAALGFAAGFGDTFFLVALPIVVVGPPLALAHRRRERVESVENQVVGWLQLLSNGLKSTGSLGEALRATAKVVPAPLGEELDVMLKEVTLGNPLEEALDEMGQRVGSSVLKSAVTTIVVGKRTGGDLPWILAETADALREMERLEGVLRTKTADGKTQAYVISGVPFVLLGCIHAMDPNWLPPLTQSGLGIAIVLVAVVLWFGAVMLARKILAVEL